MELKVWMDGVERSVSGVSEATTCTHLIYALAHATGQKGKFVLVECYRNTERSLSPNDRPVEMLRRWNDKAGDVTYMLRRLDNDMDIASSESSSTYTATESTSGKPLSAQQRESSTSSFASVNLPYNGSMRPSNYGQSSTSSLPAYSEASLQRRRPPPPDYNSTMERKMAGLVRTAEGVRIGGNGNGVNGRNVPIGELGMTANELIALIQQQDTILEEQRARLKLTELNAQSEDEREFIQLHAQQKNLRRVLEGLRKTDWGRQYEEETLWKRQLRAKLLATQEKITLIRESRSSLCNQEADLWLQLHQLANDDQSIFQTPEGTAFPFVNNNDQLTRVHTAI